MKRLLILTSKTGGGHVSVARAIAAACYELYGRGLDVRIVDPFSLEHRSVFDRITRMYGSVVVHFPNLWRAAYHASDHPAMFAILRRLSAPVFRERIRSILNEHYDLVLSVHPFCHHLVHPFRERGQCAQLAVLITDLVNVHSAWSETGADFYLTPSEEVDEAVRRFGADAVPVRQCGLPVHPDFGRAPSEPAIARAALGLDASKFTVVIHGGGEGAGNIAQTVASVDGGGLPIQIVVICGRNARARRRLESQAFTQTVHVWGFVNNMPMALAAADVVVTKAGSVSIAEALAVGRPVVISGAIPGQERGNPAYVRERGVGIVAMRPGRVVPAVRRYFESLELRAETIQRTTRFGRPEAAFTAARVLAEALEMPEALILRSNTGKR